MKFPYLGWPYSEGLIESATTRYERDSCAYSRWDAIAGKYPQHRFSTESHRFYIGKMVPESDEDSAYHRPKKNIYSEECIAGLLAILFDHLDEGAVAQFVICPQLSSWFNGEEESQYAHSPETQGQLIYSIAKKRFGKDKKDLRVINIEADPKHAALIQRIKSSIDPSTGLCDVHQAFRGEAGPGNDSLTLATLLFQAAQQNDPFRQALYSTLPKRLKKNPAELDDTEILQADGYSIAELGIRISDLLAGCAVQGGVERQNLYDKIIEALFELSQDPPKGRFRKVESLKPIAARLHSRNFTGVYLRDEANYFKHRPRQISARIRLSIYGLLGASSLGGAYWLGSFDQRLIEEHREEYFEQCLTHVSGLSEDTLERRREFDHFLSVVGDELAVRYGVPHYNNSQVIDAFSTDFCHGDTSWISPHTPRVFIQDHVDDFVQADDLAVITAGGNPDTPYGYLDSYKDDFRAALQVTSETQKEWSSSGVAGSEHAIANIIDLNGDENLLLEDLYGRHTLASTYQIEVRDIPGLPPSEPTTMYSTLKGREVVEDLVATRERFEARRITPFFNQAHWDFETTVLPNELAVHCDSEGSGCSYTTEYPGFLGPNFTLALYYSDGRFIPVAKKDGEENFSYRSALEAWTRYAGTLGYSSPH